MKYYAIYANFVRSLKHLRKIMNRNSFKVKTSYAVSKVVKLRFDGCINFIACALYSAIVVKLKTEWWAVCIMEFEISILMVPPYQLIATAVKHQLRKSYEYE